ncbi:MAG: SH3 domain-containing protein [Silicimonas sp.]|nr:SH3 domain-containing protein [Silicimonas sp.]
MFRLIVATTAALYGILYVYGADDRRIEVSRQATDDTLGVTLAALDIPQLESAPTPKDDFGVSEEEAVRMALESGAKIRDERTSKPLYGVVAAVDAAGVAAATSSASEEPTAPMWYVTGNIVNLRAGPGTGNAVVGKLGFGDAAEVIGDENGWYQIRSADGAISGWIFGKFLADTRPG